jgi:hypothetical protein
MLPALTLKIGADTVDLDKALADVASSLDRLKKTTDSAGRGLQRFGDGANNLGKKMLPVSAAISGTAAAAFALTKNVAGAGDEIAKTSRAVGVSTDYLQEMRYALGQVAGVSNQEVSGAMSRLNRVIGEAGQGSKQAAEALQQLGFSQEEIARGAINTEMAFSRAVETLSEMGNASDAAALATDLFGRSGADLGGKLAGASGAVASLRDRARDLGIVMSQEALDASEKFGDQLDDVKQGFDGLKITIANELLPMFVNTLLPAINDKIIPALQSMAQGVGNAIRWFGDLPEGVQTAAGIVATALGVGGPALMAVGAFSKAIGALILGTGPIGLFIGAASLAYAAWQVWGDDIKALIAGVVGFISDGFTFATEAVTGWATSAQEAASGAIQYMTDKFNEWVEYLRALPGQLLEIGSQIIQGLLDGINAKWEELKARIFSLGELLPGWLRDMLAIQSPSRVFFEIGEFIGQGLSDGINSTFGMVEGAVANLADATTSNAFGMAKGVVDAMGQMFQGSKPIAMAQALINTFQGITEALKLPFPANLAAVAKVAAQGFAAVQGIASARPGSGIGGTARAASGGGGGGAAAQQPVTTFQFTLTNDPMGFGERFARQFIDQLNSTSRNGGQIRGVIA